MKTFDKISLPGSLFIFLILLLASCATSTPNIHLQATSLTMRLEESATGIATISASMKDPYLITTDVYKRHRFGRDKPALRIWDISKGALVKSMKERGDVIANAISPDGKYIVSSFRPWRKQSGKYFSLGMPGGRP